MPTSPRGPRCSHTRLAGGLRGEALRVPVLVEGDREAPGEGRLREVPRHCDEPTGARSRQMVEGNGRSRDIEPRGDVEHRVVRDGGVVVAKAFATREDIGKRLALVLEGLGERDRACVRRRNDAEDKGGYEKKNPRPHGSLPSLTAPQLGPYRRNRPTASLGSNLEDVPIAVEFGWRPKTSEHLLRDPITPF